MEKLSINIRYFKELPHIKSISDKTLYEYKYIDYKNREKQQTIFFKVLQNRLNTGIIISYR